MRATIFELRSGAVVTDVREEPDWQPFTEYDGEPLDGVRISAPERVGLEREPRPRG